MTSHLLVKAFLSTNSVEKLREAASTTSAFATLLKSQFGEELTSPDKTEALLKRVNSLESHDFLEVVSLYNTPKEGIEGISKLLLDIQKTGISPLQLCKEMYSIFTPFRFSLQNKVDFFL